MMLPTVNDQVHTAGAWGVDFRTGAAARSRAMPCSAMTTDGGGMVHQTGGSSSSFDEYLHSQPSRADQAAQRARRHLLVVRDGERRVLPLPNQDNDCCTGGPFPSHATRKPLPLRGRSIVATVPSGQYLHLLRFDGQCHSAFRTNCQACGNGVLDVLQSLTPCGPLTDAAGDRRTLDDPYTVLVSCMPLLGANLPSA